MKVLVTGGAGFIGSNLVDALIDKGYEVGIIDDFSTGKRSNVNLKATLHEISLHKASTDELVNILSGYEKVFHTAAFARVQPSITDPISFNDVNVNGTLNLLFACYKAGVKKVIYSASSSAYGDTKTFPTPETADTDPMSPYGLQKYIGEQYCRMFSLVYGLDTVNLRYFNIYGPRMNFEGAYKTVIGVFGQQKAQGKPLTITNDGEQSRDFTHVYDVVDANIKAAEYEGKLNGEVFNIGNGRDITINKIASLISDQKVYTGDVLEPRKNNADNTKAKQILGWEPKHNVEDFILNGLDEEVKKLNLNDL